MTERGEVHAGGKDDWTFTKQSAELSDKNWSQEPVLLFFFLEKA